MNDFELEQSVAPAVVVRLLYDAVQRLDLETFTSLVWGEASWQGDGISGRGGAELFAALL